MVRRTNIAYYRLGFPSIFEISKHKNKLNDELLECILVHNKLPGAEISITYIIGKDG